MNRQGHLTNGATHISLWVLDTRAPGWYIWPSRRGSVAGGPSRSFAPIRGVPQWHGGIARRSWLRMRSESITASSGGAPEPSLQRQMGPPIYPSGYWTRRWGPPTYPSGYWTPERQMGPTNGATHDKWGHPHIPLGTGHVSPWLVHLAITTRVGRWRIEPRVRTPKTGGTEDGTAESRGGRGRG